MKIINSENSGQIFSYTESIEDQVKGMHPPETDKDIQNMDLRSFLITSSAYLLNFILDRDAKEYPLLKELDEVDVKDVMENGMENIPKKGHLAIFINEIIWMKAIRAREMKPKGCDDISKLKVPDLDADKRPTLIMKCCDLPSALFGSFGDETYCTVAQNSGMVSAAVFTIMNRLYTKTKTMEIHDFVTGRPQLSSASEDVRARCEILLEYLEFAPCDPAGDKMLLLMVKSVKFMRYVVFESFIKLMKRIALHPEIDVKAFENTIQFMVNTFFANLIVSPTAKGMLANMLNHEIPESATGVRDVISHILREAEKYRNPVTDIIAATRSGDYRMWMAAGCVAIEYMEFLNRIGYNMPEFSFWQASEIRNPQSLDWNMIP